MIRYAVEHYLTHRYANIKDFSLIIHNYWELNNLVRISVVCRSWPSSICHGSTYSLTLIGAFSIKSFMLNLKHQKLHLPSSIVPDYLASLQVSKIYDLTVNDIVDCIIFLVRNIISVSCKVRATSCSVIYFNIRYMGVDNISSVTSAFCADKSVQYLT